MIRQEYLRRLVDNAYVDLYLSAVDGARIFWPWRMQPVHEASQRHRDACESYWVDSSFKHEDITNEDVLDTAADFNAEAAVLADVWHEKDATVDAILAGLEIYDDHTFDGDVLVPLQPPHDECYVELAGQADIYAVGGIKDWPAQDQIEAVQSVRGRAGDDVHIHGLGIGVSDELVDAVHDNPVLLDSIDYSTPMQSSMDGTIDAGKERMSVVSARAGARLVEDLRKVSPYLAEPTPEDLRDTEQVGLDEVMVR